MCPIFLSDFNPIWTFSTDRHKSSHYPVSLKFIQGEPRRYVRTDGQEPNWRFSPLIQTQDARRKNGRTNFNCCLSVRVDNYTIIVPTKCTSFFIIKSTKYYSLYFLSLYS
jgi:hypothetical protein